MDLNIKQTLNNSMFENKDEMRRSAKMILERQKASHVVINSILDESVFKNFNNRTISLSQQIDLINTYNKLDIKKSLKNTSNYITKQTHVLGELWDSLKESKVEYSGELINIEINYLKSNIFAA